MAKLQTIYELLSPYSKEEIDLVIKNLSFKDKRLIYLRYGSDLGIPDSSNWSSYYDYEFYNKLIFKMRRLLASLRKGKYISNSKAIRTIYQKFQDYSKTQVDYAISLLLDDEKQVLYLRYGNDLESPDTSNWNMEYKSKFDSICRKLETLLKNIKNGGDIKIRYQRIVTIYELLKKYCKEDIDDVLESLTPSEKHLLYLRYGSNLNNPDSSNWSKEYEIYFYKKLLPKIRRKLEKKFQEINGKQEEIVVNNSSNKEVLKIVSKTLTKLKDKRYSILLEKYSIKEILSYVLIEEMNDNYNINDVTSFFGLDRKLIIHMATKVLHNMIRDEEYKLKNSFYVK